MLWLNVGWDSMPVDQAFCRSWTVMLAEAWRAEEAMPYPEQVSIPVEMNPKPS